MSSVRHGRALIAILAAGLVRTAALASWTDVLPRPFENGAYTELLGSYERDDNRHDGNSFWWSDAFFKEKLTLFSNGYFYHPRFLQYRISVTGALRQEDYQASHPGAPGWRSGKGLEYETRLFLLPEHPYNLEAFALRYEPLYKEEAATQHDNIETSRGVLFRFRQKPWFVHARYIDEKTETGDLTTKITRAGADAEFFQRFLGGNQLSLDAGVNPTRFSNTLGLKGDSNDYVLGGLVDLQRVRLDSNLTKSRLDQDSPLSGVFKSDTLRWYELLTATLPWNFRSDVSYRYSDNESTFEEPSVSTERTLSDTTRNLQCDVVHRLYQSLDTTYLFTRNSRVSSAGDATTTSNSLTLDYSKLIPRGRVIAGLSVGRANTENRGRTDIVDEPHLGTPVPGTFRLGQQTVVRTSIAVFLKSPTGPPERIRLDENVHYTLTPVADTFEINVVALPPQFAVPGTYDFLVSYTLEVGDFTIRYDTYAYNLSVELLDNLLTPYYRFTRVASDLLAGSFPGTLLDSTTYTTGLLVRRGPWRATGEYQKLEWEVSPYRAWKAEVQYVGSLAPRTSLYATATYLDKYYPRGSSEDLREPYSDRIFTASGSLKHELPAKGLLFSAGASFSRSQGQIDTSAYSLNGALLWRIGKLDFSAGANAYRSDTEGTLAPSNSNTRTHQYYYIKIRRQLF